MARRPTTPKTDSAFVNWAQEDTTSPLDTFAHIVHAAIAPVNTDGALEQIARKAFNNGMKRPGITFEGVLAEVLKEGIRLERIASVSAAPVARGRGRPKGSMGVSKAETSDASGRSSNISRGDETEQVQADDGARANSIG